MCVLNGATVQTVQGVATVRPGPLSCSVDHTQAYMCAPRGNTKASSFVTRSDVSVLLLESQPSSGRTKRRPFRLSHLMGTMRRYQKKSQGSPCRFSLLGDGATRATRDRRADREDG